jgi:hypothetical protein
MKWFKHFSRAHEDRAVETIINEFGVAGYGLYFYCLEVIAGTIDGNNVTFELEPDAAILARRLLMDTVAVEKIMHRCIDLRLFEISDNGRITCLKIAKFLTQSETSNPEIRKIITMYHNSSQNITDNHGVHDQIRLELDKKNIKSAYAQEKREEEVEPVDLAALLASLSGNQLPIDGRL